MMILKNRNAYFQHSIFRKKKEKILMEVVKLVDRYFLKIAIWPVSSAVKSIMLFVHTYQVSR